MEVTQTIFVFLAVQNSSIGDLVTHSLTHSLTYSLTDSLTDSLTEPLLIFDIKEQS